MKKLFLFPVMLLFALTIAACSNSPNGFEEPDTEQPETSGNDDDPVAYVREILHSLHPDPFRGGRPP